MWERRKTLNKKPYQLEVSEEQAELFIYGDIGSWGWIFEDETGAYDLQKKLEEIETKLVVHINSYGGEVKEGLGIYNLLKNFKHEVTTICDGFACSAASIIFMAGSKRIMPKSSLLMIHNAWSCGAGDSNDFKKLAEDLEKITQPSVEIYKATSNLTEERIKEMMDVESWISADEAKEYGFATEISEIEAKQSLEDSYLYKTVMKNKELEKQLNMVPTEPQPKDAWTSFFNRKKED